MDSNTLLQQTRTDMTNLTSMISQQNYNETQMRAFNQAVEAAKQQLTSSAGTYSPQNEMEFYALTKAKLELEIEEMERSIYEHTNTVTVEVTESASEQTQAPQETAVESTGVFEAISNWFLNIFSSKPDPGYPVLSKRQRDAKLKKLDSDAVKYQAQRDKQSNDAMAAMVKSRRKYGDLECRKEYVTVSYQEIRDMYVNAGWRPVERKNTPMPTNEKAIKVEIQRFLRELSNAGCLDAIDEDGNFQLNVGEFSKEDIFAILSERSDEAVRRFMQPYLDFDFKDFYSRYPVASIKDPDQIQEVYRQLFAETHKYQGYLQWFHTFADYIISPQLQKELDIAGAKIAVFSGLAHSIAMPTGISAEEYYKKDILKIDEIIESFEHASETKAMVSDYNERISREHPGVDLTAQQFGEYGLKNQGVDFLAGAYVFGEARTDKHLPFEVETLEAIRDRDVPTLTALVEKMKNAKYVTEAGRPRLCGVEPMEQILRFGAEDFEYYAELARTAFLLNSVIETDEVAGIAGGDLEQIKSTIQEIMNLYSAMADRLNFERIQQTAVENVLSNKIPDVNWFLRKQNAQMDSWEATHR